MPIPHPLKRYQFSYYAISLHLAVLSERIKPDRSSSKEELSDPKIDAYTQHSLGKDPWAILRSQCARWKLPTFRQLMNAIFSLSFTAGLLEQTFSPKQRYFRRLVGSSPKLFLYLLRFYAKKSDTLLPCSLNAQICNELYTEYNFSSIQISQNLRIRALFKFLLNKFSKYSLNVTFKHYEKISIFVIWPIRHNSPLINIFF